MKIKFDNKIRLSIDNLKILNIINSILEEYQEKGYKLTLRQLYYQLVSRDYIPNHQKQYAKLSQLLTRGRMAGYVDWEIIEDRNRIPYLPYFNDDISDALEDAVRHFRLDRQRNQDVYIELWVEKDALSGVLKRMSQKYHIHLVVNKGYSSTTAMYDAYNRIKRQICNLKKCYILYLGDHDPSGLDMDRDIKERLKTFILNSDEFEEEINLDAYDIYEEYLNVERLGLTYEQVQEYNPPENPAKFKDPRAKDYIKRFGRVSWEVDALKPEILHQLIINKVESLIDYDKYEELIEKETRDKKKIREVIDSFNE